MLTCVCVRVCVCARACGCVCVCVCVCAKVCGARFEHVDVVSCTEEETAQRLAHLRAMLPPPTRSATGRQGRFLVFVDIGGNRMGRSQSLREEDFITMDLVSVAALGGVDRQIVSGYGMHAHKSCVPACIHMRV